MVILFLVVLGKPEKLLALNGPLPTPPPGPSCCCTRYNKYGVVCGQTSSTNCNYLCVKYCPKPMCDADGGWSVCTEGSCGGGTPDTVKPECGVRIEPYVASGNMIQNPGFETGNCSGWNCPTERVGVVEGKGWQHSGMYVLRGVDYWNVTQDIPVEQGAIYRVSLWARAVRDYSAGSWGEASVKLDGGPGGLHGYSITSGQGGDSGWVNWVSTYYAHDGTFTITLNGDMGGSGYGWYPYVYFDDIEVQKIEGAASASIQNVNLRIGAWDDRNNFHDRRIRNNDANWLDDNAGWESFGVSGAANNISWTLSGAGTVYVQVRDGAGNISNACSDTIGVKQPPICTSLTAVPTSGCVPLTVQFTGSGTDPDGGSITQYEWNFGDNFSQLTATGQVTHTYNTAGDYVVTLAVRDDEGVWSTESCALFPIDVQARGIIKGTVYEITNPTDRNCVKVNSGTLPGLSGATITTSGKASLTTSSNPAYSFTNLCPGGYILSASKTDYRDPIYCPGASVTLPEGQTRIVNIGLTKLLGPWFQTEGGDSHGQGGISSPVPDGEYFCKDSPYTPAYPGVVSYVSATEPGFAPNRISSKGWLANSSTLLSYNFNYFYSLLDSPTENWLTGNALDFPANPGTGETEIVYTTRPAHLPGFTNLSGRKIIVLTSSNAIIENNITLANDGFLAVIAAQHINISDSVSRVQGVYIASETGCADGCHISTGEGTVKFEGQGIFYARKFELHRDLDPDKTTGNNIAPAETFIFRPDLVLNTPKELRVSKMSWLEVAP